MRQITWILEWAATILICLALALLIAFALFYSFLTVVFGG